MKSYTREEIDKHIQWLITFMRENYPNGFELVINSMGGELRGKYTEMSFISADLYSVEGGFNIRESIREALKTCCCCDAEEEKNEHNRKENIRADTI